MWSSGTSALVTEWWASIALPELHLVSQGLGQITKTLPDSFSTEALLVTWSATRPRTSGRRSGCA
jgi:hypothetical protein